jgi:NAD(P)-dependent dehydrogenase (short-subunit alcohol dehydrogenase family)
MSHTPTVIVTGAAHGIGRAVAERLGSAGARVLVNYRSDAGAAESAVTAIRAAGGEATAVHADVAVPEQVRQLFDVARECYSDPRVVVHCAAVTHFAPLAQATGADYDRVFDANTRATFATLRAAAGRVVDEGRIIVISSGAAVVPRARYPSVGWPSPPTLPMWSPSWPPTPVAGSPARPFTPAAGCSESLSRRAVLVAQAAALDARRTAAARDHAS